MGFIPPAPGDNPGRGLYDTESAAFFEEALPQAVDVKVQGALIALEIVAPDVFDELVAREGFTRIAGQLEQQLEFPSTAG
jgi:hypothetical protein